MLTRDIFRLLESWAPTGIAWDRDNVGLQIGSPDQPVRKTLVALDVTEGVIREAIRKRTDLVISHHPLYFHKPRTIRLDQRLGRLTAQIIEGKLSVYSLHTNLDYAHNGVSVALAEALELNDIGPLHSLPGHYQKVVVFVPVDFADSVMSAMSNEGAGAIGQYDECSFQIHGTGTFRPLQGAKPFIGTMGKRERVDEIRLEMIVPRWKTESVLTAMRKAHPYEEVAFDIYDLSNQSPQFGAGAIGTLRRSISLGKFLSGVKASLDARAVRYCGKLERKVSTVAVCGGSGGEYLEAAIGQKADVFLTADLRYHTFQECDDRLALVDAGHYETELPVLRKIASYLLAQAEVIRSKIQVIISQEKTNFIHTI